MVTVAVAPYRYIYGISILFFLTGLPTSPELADFRKVRHGCFSIRLFAAHNSRPISASKPHTSQCCSDYGACGFVLAGHSGICIAVDLCPWSSATHSWINSDGYMHAPQYFADGVRRGLLHDLHGSPYFEIR